MKNTIFEYLGWKDYDQKKGHPTILCELGAMNGIRLTSFEEYIAEGGFDKICSEMIDWYSVDDEDEVPLSKNDIKRLFNARIYGGGHQKWCDSITQTNLSPKDVLKLRRKGKMAKEMKNIRKPHPFYLRFDADATLISTLICEGNPEIIKIECADMPYDVHETFSKVRNRCVSVFCGIVVG